MCGRGSARVTAHWMLITAVVAAQSVVVEDSDYRPSSPPAVSEKLLQ